MKTIFTKDLPNKKMYVTREFSANLEQVWQAWTDPKILDNWWAPKPWKANTKSMNFKDGGTWLYCMEGPAGEKHWGIASFNKIIQHKSYEGIDSFCDENGKIITEYPTTQWKNKFSATENGTKVEVEMTFSSEEALKQIIEMGFEQGFTMAHGNLDEILKK